MRSEQPSTTHASTVNSEAPIAGIKPDATLDVRGLWCPLPPLKTVAALRTLKPGQVLEVLGTNPVGNRVAPWVVQKLGDQLLASVADEAGFSRFYFERAL